MTDTNSARSSETCFRNYSKHVPERSRNRVEFREDIVVKRSDDLSGEIYWYQNIPPSIKYLFPNLLEAYSPTLYKVERINGTTLTHLYLKEQLTCELLTKLLTTLEEIHNSEIPDNDVDIYKNYLDKIVHRYYSYDYSRFPNHLATYQKLFEHFRQYRRIRKGKITVIHGDPVFTNILLTDNFEFRFVDMRGKQGQELSIYGDKWYDFGKIYQSLIGYDEVLLEIGITDEYKNELRECFENYVIDHYGSERMEEIKWITAILLFTLIPLHDNTKCDSYYSLIDDLIQ